MIKEVCAVVLACCLAHPTEARDKRKDTEFPDAIAKIRSSVVQIQMVTTINSQVTVDVAGTGFVVSKTGLVATAEHVVRSIENSGVRHPEAHVTMQVGFAASGSFSSVECKVAARDPVHDLAILSLMESPKAGVSYSAVSINTAKLREGTAYSPAATRWRARL